VSINISVARYGAGFFSALAAFVILVHDARSQENAEHPCVVVVPPFENASRIHQTITYEIGIGKLPNQGKKSYRIDRMTEAGRSALENILVNIEGVTVVARQPADALLVETEFGGLNGLKDQGKAIHLGRKLHANVVVLGKILELSDDHRGADAYGVAVVNSKAVCQVNIAVLDIASGKIKFSKEFKGTKASLRTNFGGNVSTDRHFAALEAALEHVKSDSGFVAALLGRKPPTADAADASGLVEVDFSPMPDNCDIEINGKYVGGSPLKRRLPGGKELKIRITRDGYKDWEGVIVPEQGLRITRELGPSRRSP
jgi:curli biogenesis system outer membrane secretion channel CsgG